MLAQAKEGPVQQSKNNTVGIWLSKKKWSNTASYLAAEEAAPGRTVAQVPQRSSKWATKAQALQGSHFLDCF